MFKALYKCQVIIIIIIIIRILGALEDILDKNTTTDE